MNLFLFYLAWDLVCFSTLKVIIFILLLGESQPLSLNNTSSSFFLFFPLEFLLHILDVSFYLPPLTYPHFFHLVHCSVFLSSFFKYAFHCTNFLSFLIIKAFCLLPIPPSCFFLIHCILLSPSFCFLYYFLMKK